MLHSKKARSSVRKHKLGGTEMHLGTIAAAMVVSALAAPQAMAQTTEAAPAPAAESSDQTDIVVSAKRIGVTEQTAPIAVTGFNADALKERGITSTQDLNSLVPGLNAGLELGIPKLFIRGVGQEATTLGQDPAVTTYVDGVPIARSKAGYVTQVDIARVEVLRGPQGTTFGRNATAGAVNYITQRPTAELEVIATAGLGTYDRFNAGLTINLPLSPDLAFRVAGVHTEHKGYVENLGTGPRNLDSQNINAVRGSLQYQSGDITVVLGADYDREKSNGPAFLLLDQAFVPPYGVTPDDYVLANKRRVTKLNADNGQANYTNVETYGTNLTIEAALNPDLKLKSISAFRKLTFRQAQDSDGTILSLVGANPVLTASKQYSQEFNLSGESGGFNAVVGAFAFYEDAFESSDVKFFRGLLDPALGPAALAPALIVYETNLRTTSLAAFADASYSITPAVRLNGGVRYTHDTKKDLQTSYLLIGSTTRGQGFLGDQCAAPGGTVPVSVDTTLKNSKLTWKAGVDADISDDVFAFATVSTGYKAGGFTDFSACGLTFQPENARNYEVGLKLRFPDNAGRLRLAAYYLDYTDLQVQKVTAFGTTTINASGAKLYGVEAEAETRINDMFSVDGNATWMKSKYGSDFEFGGVALGGERLPRTPKFTANLGFEGRLPFDDGSSLTARIEGYYSSKFKLTPDAGSALVDPNAVRVQPAYAIGNVYVTYKPNEQFEIRAWVRNFTNKFYLTGALPLALPGINSGFAAPPRTVGMDVTVNF
ncbi:TonB-dependent receptor [Sphingopyxis terrae]|uniref:TonB-dependent receptor n=1 Tax=Sphingopyxis terrae TaxID=33052 RepID=UPI002A0B57E7|nr:TonB-dependent receptor [Sphingopyxis terrae]MDX8356404.1 TonB-dependent receptor [Sphingopyxis terrae]